MSDSVALEQRLRKLEATLEALASRERTLYLENTWVPTLGGTGGGGVFTYTTRAGSYTRMGRFIIAAYTITLATFTSAPAGNLEVQDLPFAARNGTPNGTVNITLTNAALSAISRGAVINNTTVCRFFDASGVAIAASVISLAINFQGIAFYEAA